MSVCIQQLDFHHSFVHYVHGLCIFLNVLLRNEFRKILSNSKHGTNIFIETVLNSSCCLENIFDLKSEDSNQQVMLLNYSLQAILSAFLYDS
jgi:hypothetical protein